MLRQRCIIIMIQILCLGIQGTINQDGMNVPVNKNSTMDNLWRKCDLPWEEVPDYNYFMNAQQRHYNLSLENDIAIIISDYVRGTKMENEHWELNQICHYRDDIYRAYTESDMGSELYILFTIDTPDAFPYYIIAADIQKTGNEDILMNGEYSYNSMLEWYSYAKWFDGACDMKEGVEVNIIGDLYDSVYGNGSYYAIYDYLDRFDKDKEADWKIDENSSYVGRNGEIASISCAVGTRKINLFVDVWNKTYAVLE